jgi:hypothetical protein
VDLKLSAPTTRSRWSEWWLRTDFYYTRPRVTINEHHHHFSINLSFHCTTPQEYCDR